LQGCKLFIGATAQPVPSVSKIGLVANTAQNRVLSQGKNLIWRLGLYPFIC